jgi:DNA-binding PadR family transcriptional regulator
MTQTLTTSNRDPGAELPLTAAVCSILLALADGEKHGYAIMQAVAAETGGGVAMGPGTLYGSLDRMLRARLVEESEGGDRATGGSERRRYYQLTDFGRRVLCAEVARLERAVRLARRKKLIVRSATGAHP